MRESASARFPSEHVELILDATHYAPSPENSQQWRSVAICDGQQMKDLMLP